jgi:hypothetical protein
MTSITGHDLVTASAIENIIVMWDVDGDGSGDKFVATYDTAKANAPLYTTGPFATSGAAGEALKGVVVGAAAKHSAELAQLGSNTTHSYSDIYYGAVKQGEWIMGIDRTGTASDQALRGRLDDILPTSIQDILAAAKNVSDTVFRA